MTLYKNFWLLYLPLHKPRLFPLKIILGLYYKLYTYGAYNVTFYCIPGAQKISCLPTMTWCFCHLETNSVYHLNLLYEDLLWVIYIFLYMHMCFVFYFVLHVFCKQRETNLTSCQLLEVMCREINIGHKFYCVLLARFILLIFKPILFM